MNLIHILHKLFCLFIKIFVLSKLFIFISLFNIHLLLTCINAQCNINIFENYPPPLISRNNTIIYPDPNQRTIQINEQETVNLSCPGGTILFNDNFTNFTNVEATCLQDGAFEFANQARVLSYLKCSIEPQNTARPTSRSCTDGHNIIEIGYDIENGNFLPQIEICFDEHINSPIYSHYNLTASIGHHICNIQRPFFVEDGFYSSVPTRLDSLYNRNNQRANINNLLGLNSNSDKYIKRSGELFLSRGHLTAKGDFVYGCQQVATFHYVNSAPQWASFNGGNWNDAEISVRNYAESGGVNLRVYTGVHGIATLPDEATGKSVELYLDGYNNKMPVPELFWKVVYEPLKKKAIVILGVNNPYERNISAKIICKDISDKIPWLVWKKRNIERGYSYACPVDDVKHVLKGFPDIEVTDILN